ncbi:MAG: polypeptide subunit release factor methylase [Verrucomicrobiales bacterium]
MSLMSPIRRFFNENSSSQFSFEGRSYAISRRVFDPKHHLSGLAFASVLGSYDLTGQRVLELGTGCGLLAGVAHDHGGDVVATDISTAAVTCATTNLRHTNVDVRLGDLFEPVLGESFDLLIVNPPYEIGRAWNPVLRSPDMLERLASSWRTYAARLLLAFPTDSIDVLRSVGINSRLLYSLPTSGRELGIFGD